MNIETVNELIQSLESAGELSIKETKVIALAKAFKQLAAENVGLRPLIAENWNMRDLLRQLMAGRPGGVYFNKWEKLIIGVLNETPATDRILAEAEAQGVEKAIECIVQTITPNHETILKEFAAQLRKGADK